MNSLAVAAADWLVRQMQPEWVERNEHRVEDYRLPDGKQAHEQTGFQASQFVMDWQHECATCPAGKSSQSWTPAQDRRDKPVIKIKFAVPDCLPCHS